MRGDNYKNCARIVYKTLFRYFPAACVSSGQCAVTNSVKEDISLKSPTHGGVDVVVSNTGSGGLELQTLGWFLQFSINCKNG